MEFKEENNHIARGCGEIGMFKLEQGGLETTWDVVSLGDSLCTVRTSGGMVQVSVNNRNIYTNLEVSPSGSLWKECAYFTEEGTCALPK
jgi:hypothetical protein